MTQALLITGIGMGLVFLAILLLWGLMALLVRLTAERPVEEFRVQVEIEPDSITESRQALRQRAAAAAVAVALRLQAPASTAKPATVANLSTWQAVQRSVQLQQTVRPVQKRGGR